MTLRRGHSRDSDCNLTNCYLKPAVVSTVSARACVGPGFGENRRLVAQTPLMCFVCLRPKNKLLPQWALDDHPAKARNPAALQLVL